MCTDCLGGHHPPLWTEWLTDTSKTLLSTNFFNFFSSADEGILMSRIWFGLAIEIIVKSFKRGLPVQKILQLTILSAI